MSRSYQIEKVQQVICDLEKEGWTWGRYGNDKYIFAPPINDHRINWACEWIEIEPNKYIPHYILRDC